MLLAVTDSGSGQGLFRPTAAAERGRQPDGRGPRRQSSNVTGLRAQASGDGPEPLESLPERVPDRYSLCIWRADRTQQSGARAAEPAAPGKSLRTEQTCKGVAGTAADSGPAPGGKDQLIPRIHTAGFAAGDGPTDKRQRRA